MSVKLVDDLKKSQIYTGEAMTLHPHQLTVAVAFALVRKTRCDALNNIPRL